MKKDKSVLREEGNAIRKHIEKLITPIFNKVPQETRSNSMTTINHQKPIFKILWRPNNYRRKIKVKIKDNSTIKNIKSAIPKANINSHTKLISIKNYKGITIQYGKNTLTGILSQQIIYGSKETILIEAYNIKDLDERVNQKKEEKRKKIDKALFDFIKEFNLRIMFEKPIWDRYEDWIKGEEYIDKISKECIIHDTYFKKVYPTGIEFKSSKDQKEPIVLMKNYIKNRAVEDIAPEIQREFRYVRSKMYRDHKNILEFNEVIKVLTEEAVKPLTVQIKLHLKVLRKMDKNQDKFNKLLNKKLGEEKHGV